MKIKNKNDALEAVKESGWNLEYVGEEFKDLEICLTAVEKDAYVFKYVPDTLKTYEFYLEAVKLNGDIMCKVPKKFKTHELCLEAVKSKSTNILYVEEETEELLLAAITHEKDLSRLRHTFNHIDNHSKEICMAFVKQNPLILEEMPYHMQSREICMEAVKINGMALKYAGFDDEEIIMEAVKENGAALQFAKVQTPEICIAAIQSNKKAWFYVDDYIGKEVTKILNDMVL